MAGKQKDRKKRNWPLYIGIFSIVGAIVMNQSGSVGGAYFYIIVATCCFGLAFNKRKKHATENTPCVKNEDVPAAVIPEDPQTTTEKVEEGSIDEPEVDYINKTYRVTGIEHYLDNLLKLAVPNSNYDMTKREIIDYGMTDQNIWEYEFYPSKLELQPEPDNSHDPNAIKVLIDDQHVGYIKSGSCKHLLNVIDQDRFIGATCKIGGGKYKRVDEEYDYDRDKTIHNLDKGEKSYSIVITVKEKGK